MCEAALSAERAERSFGMREFKYFVIGDSPYITPHYALMSKLQSMLAEVRAEAVKSMRGADAAHCVYAVRIYGGPDGSGELEQVDFYSPAVLLNDFDFYSRTEAEMKDHPGCIICAAHKLC
jgi:hypothetical protein